MIIFWGALGGNQGPSIDPGVGNVLAGVSYMINGVPLVGTYIPNFQNSTSGYEPLPDVSHGMFDWFQAMTFIVLTKTVVNFQNFETELPVNFRGVWQPFNSEQLMLKPEGQRSWPWYMLHSQISLDLKVDDIVQYLGVKYRVMHKTDYKKYGYKEYHLVEDWVNN